MAAASDASATTREVSGLWKGWDKKAMGEKIRREHSSRKRTG
jgi:hypothetical protein